MRYTLHRHSLKDINERAHIVYGKIGINYKSKKTQKKENFKSFFEKNKLEKIKRNKSRRCTTSSNLLKILIVVFFLLFINNNNNFIFF
jgi:hypothetical protein